MKVMTLTRDSILAMEAGREMDALVAQVVMKLTVYRTEGEWAEAGRPAKWDSHDFPICHPGNGAMCRQVSPYSTDIGEAWEMEEQLLREDLPIQWGYAARLHNVLDIPFGVVLPAVQEFRLVHATPLERCKAALMAVMGL